MEHMQNERGGPEVGGLAMTGLEDKKLNWMKLYLHRHNNKKAVEIVVSDKRITIATLKHRIAKV